MLVYWDTEDHSFIIENDNGKRMRVSSSMVEINPTSDHIVMRDAVLIHKVDLLDTINIGDQVKPNEVARDGVVLQLLGTRCLVVYCQGQWRLENGNGLPFIIDRAILHSKKDDVFLEIVHKRLMDF